MMTWMMAGAAFLWCGQAMAVPVFMCTDDAMCDEGESCFDGDCLPTCTSDADCDDGFGCVSGMNATDVDPGPPCREDDDDCGDAP